MFSTKYGRTRVNHAAGLGTHAASTAQWDSTRVVFPPFQFLSPNRSSATTLAKQSTTHLERCLGDKQSSSTGLYGSGGRPSARSCRVRWVRRSLWKGVLLTNAKKVTVSVLYWYEELSGHESDKFLNDPKGFFLSFVLVVAAAGASNRTVCTLPFQFHLCPTSVGASRWFCQRVPIDSPTEDSRTLSSRHPPWPSAVRE